MLEKVIQQLPEHKFEQFTGTLVSAKGEKLLQLLQHYKSGNNSEDEIISKLNLNSSSYYTLRSRLFDKIQVFLFQGIEFEGAELLKNVHAIPFVIFNYPRETAIALLLHLEAELIRLDMQSELVSVYCGLKKLHLNSEKYYHYEKLYNKTVAYTLAQDKAEELLSIFSKTLSGYLLSGISSTQELLILYLKEIHNQTLLYDSPKLNLYHKLAYLNYVILVDARFSEFYPDKTKEELIKECHEAITSFKHTDFNSHLSITLQLLSHQYYHSIKQPLQDNHFIEVFTKAASILCNLNPVTCPGVFFLTLLEKSKDSPSSLSYLKSLLDSFQLSETDQENEILYIYYHIALSGMYYEEDKIPQCLNALQKLINYNFFKKYSRCENEIKMFYIFILLLELKLDLAESTLRSILRKPDKPWSDPQSQFIALLKSSLLAQSSSKQKKVFEAFRLFRLINTNAENAFLPYITIKEKHVLAISMI